MEPAIEVMDSGPAENAAPLPSSSNAASPSSTEGADVEQQSRKERVGRKSNRESRRSSERRRSIDDVHAEERAPGERIESIEVSDPTTNVNKATVDPDNRKSKIGAGETTITDTDETLAPDPPVPPGEHTWEKLNQIEKRRRDVLLRGELGFWRTIACIDGTVMTLIIEDPILYITMALYVIMRLVARYASLPNYTTGLAGGNLTTIGGFITFFLALYVNNTHARYFKQYDLAMACKGRILDVASLSVTYLPKPIAYRIVRYMNAAHVQGYVGLSDTYSYPNFFVKLNREFGLLTNRELERMNHIDLDKGGSCNRELIVWCLHEIQACHAQGIIDHQLAAEFRDHILRLRAAIGSIYDAADLPVPFFYMHFISILALLYMPLFAIAAAYSVGVGTEVFWVADILVFLVVILQVIFVNGLRLLGQKMTDPFGDDLTDLSVIFFVNFTWTNSNRILESSYVDTRDFEEAKVKKRQISLGAAWEPRKEAV